MDPELWHYAMTKMSGVDVLSLCQVDRRFEQICKNELFWERKVNLDFNEKVGPLNVSWRKFYIGLAKG